MSSKDLELAQSMDLEQIEANLAECLDYRNVGNEEDRQGVAADIRWWQYRKRLRLEWEAQA